MQFKKLFFALFIIIILSIEVLVKMGTLSPLVFQLIFNKKVELKKVEPEKLNILLLGIGGGSHDGPNLTDTIIFASLNLKNPKITLISLPRDIWISDIDEKINFAYAKGEAKRKGGGLILAKTVVSKVTGQPIDYVMVLDFSGFVKAVNVLGGIDVNIENTFDDYQYPIEGNENELCGHTEEEVKTFTASNSAETDLPDFFPCRYEHLHFDKGIAHLDGETALKFVRSRHAKGSEGTDFARSQRQEKVIAALKNKAFSLQILNPAKILGLYSAIQNSVHTDIKTNEFDDFIKVANKFKNAEIKSVVVDAGDEGVKRGGLLTHPDVSSIYNYKWVLIPKAGKDNYSEIGEYIRCRLVREDCIISEIP
jgi:polyisoprenyl-teichoic acid--peptidoglycan teichoic acid transferase